MAGPLRQAWDTPPGLDAQLEELLAGAASDELRGMLAALGITPPGGTSQRLAALVEHHGDRPVWPPRWRSRCAGPAGTPRSSPSRLPRDRSPPPRGGEVDREASAAAVAFAAQAASILSACSTAAPARLKSGGIGARELARVGKAAQAGDAVVRLTLETAHAAGLLALDGDRVVPTAAYGT
ncbi:hypothetical protein ACFYP6_37565 [Streptomyces goshikiensis]|uniref:hypothetical protein n=1 Tax=Streptomyces goshikiensis TaxID=1942 RepID=UPI003692DE62